PRQRRPPRLVRLPPALREGLRIAEAGGRGGREDAARARQNARRLERYPTAPTMRIGPRGDSPPPSGSSVTANASTPPSRTIGSMIAATAPDASARNKPAAFFRSPLMTQSS